MHFILLGIVFCVCTSYSYYARALRNPFAYEEHSMPQLQCGHYAAIQTKKSTKKCASIKINGQHIQVCAGDAVGSITIKEVRPEGIVVSTADNYQVLQPYTYK